MSQSSKLCNCSPNDFTTTSEGEIICKCAIVVGNDLCDISSFHSKTNLVQDNQLGTKRTGKYFTEKFINTYSDLSSISNICHLLVIPISITHDIWRWHRKLTPLLDMTKAKIIFLVIYVMCRYNAIPLEEERLQKSIETYLHVSNTPNSLKVISKAFSFLDFEGRPILQKTGFVEFLKNNTRFLLFTELKTLEKKYPDKIDKIRKVCYELLPTIPDDPQSMKKLIKIAKKRCKVC